MENKKDIGKTFREKLNALEDSPSDGLWQAIEADLDKKKKRRFLPFWFLLFTAMVLGISALVFNANNEENSEGFSDPGTGSVRSGKTKVSGNNRDGSLVIPGNNNGNVDSSQSDGHQIEDGATMNPKRAASSPNLHREKSLTTPSEQIAVGTKSPENNKNESGQNANKNKFAKNGKMNRKKVQDKHLIDLADSSNDPNADELNAAESNRGKNNNGKDKLGNSTDKSHAPAAINPSATQTELASGKTPTTVPYDPKQSTADISKTIVEPTADSLKSNPDKKLAPKEPIADLPKPGEKDSAKTKSNLMQKVRVFVYGAPTSGGYFSDKSPFDKRLNANAKTFEHTLSYGAYAIYEATERWSLRFGMAIMNLRMVTKDATVNTLNYSYIDYSKNSNVSIYAQSNNAKTMDIIQEISYFEVPLELKYAISRRRFGVNAYGGLSALFISKNVVAGQTPNGTRYEIGKTTNLSSNSYTIAAGIGIDYKFSKSIRLNVEPVFRYHLLDYKDIGLMPYSIGLMTGLEFSFQ